MGLSHCFICYSDECLQCGWYWLMLVLEAAVKQPVAYGHALGFWSFVPASVPTQSCTSATVTGDGEHKRTCWTTGVSNTVSSPLTWYSLWGCLGFSISQEKLWQFLQWEALEAWKRGLCETSVPHLCTPQAYSETVSCKPSFASSGICSDFLCLVLSFWNVQ